MRQHSSLEIGSMGILQPNTQVLILVCGDVFADINGEALSDAWAAGATPSGRDVRPVLHAPCYQWSYCRWLGCHFYTVTPHGHCKRLMGRVIAREVGEKELIKKVYSAKLFSLSKPFKKTLTKTLNCHILPKNHSNSNWDGHTQLMQRLSSFDYSKKTSSVAECWTYNPQSK